MRTSTVRASEYLPLADQRVLLHDVTWAEFEALLSMKRESATPRIAYDAGELELMSPSKQHERIKSLIGSLVVAFCEEKGLIIGRYGSWTLKNAPRQAGVEPDECFIVGDDQDKDLPDLAIEVVWTSGGLGTLEIYRRLGIREVWQWREGRLHVFVLRRRRYAPARHSSVLPGIDLDLIAAHLTSHSETEALRAFRQAISRGAHVRVGKRR